jgi:hypothetical protein
VLIVPGGQAGPSLVTDVIVATAAWRAINELAWARTGRTEKAMSLIIAKLKVVEIVCGD